MPLAPATPRRTGQDRRTGYPPPPQRLPPPQPARTHDGSAPVSVHRTARFSRRRRPAWSPASRPLATRDVAVVINDGPSPRRRRHLHLQPALRPAPVLWTKQVLGGAVASARWR